MENACFNCGQIGHNYAVCFQPKPPEMNFKKESKKAFRLKHPEINQKSLQSRVQRMAYYNEGAQIPVDLIMLGMEQLIDELMEIWESLNSRKVRIIMGVWDQGLRNHQKLYNKLTIILPEIQMLTAYAKSHFFHKKQDMDYLTANIMKGKELDLRTMRDKLVSRVNTAKGCFEKMRAIYFKYEGTSGRPELEEWIHRLNDLSDDVDIYLPSDSEILRLRNLLLH